MSRIGQCSSYPADGHAKNASNMRRLERQPVGEFMEQQKEWQ